MKIKNPFIPPANHDIISRLSSNYRGPRKTRGSGWWGIREETEMWIDHSYLAPRTVMDATMAANMLNLLADRIYAWRGSLGKWMLRLLLKFLHRLLLLVIIKPLMMMMMMMLAMMTVQRTMRLQCRCYWINSQLPKIIDCCCNCCCCWCRRWWQHSRLAQMPQIFFSKLPLFWFPHSIRIPRLRIRIRIRWLLFGYLRNRLQLNYLSCQLMMMKATGQRRAEKREFLKIFHTYSYTITHTHTDTHTTHTHTKHTHRVRAESVKNRTSIQSVVSNVSVKWKIQ